MSGFYEINEPYTGRDRYSEPQMRLFEDESGLQVLGFVNEFLQRPDIRVLAISPALPGQSWHEVDPGKPGYPGYYQQTWTVTVLFQTRIDPNRATS